MSKPDQSKDQTPDAKTAGFPLQIAELQAANADLRERLEQYRIIFETMDEGFAICEMIFDAEGRPIDFRYLRVNPAFARLTGFPADQVIGKTVKELIPTIEPEWIEGYNRVVKSGRSERIDYSVAELGKYYDVYVWRSGEGRFAVIFNDITEHKQMENKINDLYKKRKIQTRKLQEESRAKSYFIDVLAHELRTPLTALLSSSEMLATVKQIEDDLKTRLAANINLSAQSLAKQLDDVLETVRFSRGGVKLNLESTDVAIFIQEVAARFKPALDQHSQKLELAIGTELPTIQLDRSRMEQVIINLVSNASKYSPQKSSIFLTARNQNKGLILEFKDHGVGIAPEDKKYLFQSYRRVGQNKHISGTGLGLSVCKQIVEAHGGRISVTTELGQGSTFTVFIPCEPS